MKCKMILAILIAILALSATTVLAGSVPNCLGVYGESTATAWGTNGNVYSYNIPHDGGWWHVYKTDVNAGIGVPQQEVCEGANPTCDPSGNWLGFWSRSEGKYALTLLDTTTNTTIDTTIRSDDFQSRISWGNNNKLYCTQVNGNQERVASYQFGTGLIEGATGWGARLSHLDPSWSARGILFSDITNGIKLLDWHGIESTVLPRQDWYNMRNPQYQNGRLFWSSLMWSGVRMYHNGQITRLGEGNDPVFDPSGRFAAINGTGPGWVIQEMPNAAVPEPGSILALATGLIGLAGIVRRRK